MATLRNQALVEKMGEYAVLNLGNGTGYFDLGSAMGARVAELTDVGDFTALNMLLSTCTKRLAEGRAEYPVNAVAEFEDAVAVAQEMVTQNIASQLLIDARCESL